ncbi:MAG: hypothetical protein IJK58_05935, partial [Clostridia bacterium]|nr:hypothetical protein [Clostridia bacterium]
MAKKIICAITALIFITSMLVFPTSAGVTVQTAPTCTEPGVSIRDGQTINVAPLGHDWGPCSATSFTEEVTYTRTCARCGATETVTDSEPEVTNYAFGLRQALPEAVEKDGVISPGEY